MFLLWIALGVVIGAFLSEDNRKKITNFFKNLGK